MITKLLLFLSLFVCSQANAFYNSRITSEAIRLGLGDIGTYSSVIYACDMGSASSFTGNDTAGDGSLATPYRTWGKAKSTWNSLAAGTAIALCRGGVFYVNDNGGFMANYNAKRETPITVTDYQPDNRYNRPQPVIMLLGAGSSNRMFNLEDSGGANSEEGIVVKNIEITSMNSGYNSVMRLVNDTDHIIFDNCYIHHLGMAFNMSVGMWAEIRVAEEIINDLTFTSVPDGPDTIARATGTWGAGVRRGDGVSVKLSNGNNKVFRVDERVSDTVLAISEGRTWEVTPESNTVGVSVKIYTSDLLNSNIILSNSKFTHNVTAAYFGALNEGRIHDSEFDNNGYDRAGLDHNVYLSESDNYRVDHNIFTNNGIRNGTCQSVSFVVHGHTDGAIVEDNFFYEEGDKVSLTCYSISIDEGGYKDVFETFDNLIIRNNVINNTGSVGIGCSACQNVEIYGNYITSNRALNGVRGIVVPDRSLITTYGVHKTSNVSIHDNTIRGLGAGAMISGSEGIHIGSGVDTEGTITVKDNTVSNFHNCISPGPGTGATVTVTGNTTTGCATGAQP
jgi:hypothetical protein